MSAYTAVLHLVKSAGGMTAYARLTRRLYDIAYDLPQWDEVSTYNYGYATVDDPVARDWPGEAYQIQLYAEVAKAVRAVAGPAPLAPSRLLEICCGRSGGLAYLCRELAPTTAIGLDRSLPPLRFGSTRYGAVAHIQGDALKLPLASATIDLAVNVEAMHNFPKLPFLIEISRVLSPTGIFAAADSMPWAPEICQVGLTELAGQAGLTVESFRDITANVRDACRADGPRRRGLIARLPWYYRSIAREWVAVPGSTRFAQLEQQKRCYFLTVMRKI
jgi:SAM-dependent methyltransferase